MFNRNKVAKLQTEVKELNYLKNDADRFSRVIFRAVSILIPCYGHIQGIQSGYLYDQVTVFEWYLDGLEKKAKEEGERIEREAKELKERQKIENIVLDLKNRKWEPISE